MKKIILSAALALSAVMTFSQLRAIPGNVIMDEAITLDKGGACYAFKLNPKGEAFFWPACVMFTDKGLIAGVSKEKPYFYGHELGWQTDYFFFPNSEVNKDAFYKLGLTARIGLLWENNQWNIVSIEPEKTGGGNHVAIVCIAGNVSTKLIDDNNYKTKLPDLWHPKTKLVGGIVVGIFVNGNFPWPFSLWSAANQK